ncbi:MAG: CoB--CoM heterodisulfide reductase iron-sulfur subunit B family protein [Ignisphaera sp.]|nr:CoB--CoM heterodisulfide reductase iron-sulfur subunit B family protein [Ignisphaera sp.]MDW8085366.1 CoB--CoM heterodisulfide reductase iron-sulfur subunit B family protein [Ignisphaera sp.]
MVKLAVFTGCFALSKQIAVELSTLRVLQHLNVEPIVPRSVNCCGFAFRGLYPSMSLYLTGRLLASLTASDPDGILTLCNGCYLMLREAVHRLREDRRLLESVRSYLRDEGLELRGIPRIVHPVELLHDIVGTEVLKGIKRTGDNNVLVATHYGCHALRPSTVPSFDNSVNPSKMERIVEALGFRARDYPERLDCCGAVLLATNPSLAMKLAYSKISGTARWGFHLLVTTCPYCFEMLDARQEAVMQTFGDEPRLPVMLLTQLIGLQLGLSEGDVALNLNLSPVDKVLPQIVRR